MGVEQPLPFQSPQRPGGVAKRFGAGDAVEHAVGVDVGGLEGGRGGGRGGAGGDAGGGTAAGGDGEGLREKCNRVRGLLCRKKFIVTILFGKGE